MRNIETSEAEPNNDTKVLYLLPAEARRRTFAILQRHMSTMAAPGTPECEDLMQRLAAEYSRPRASEDRIKPVAAGIEAEAFEMLRARCAICPERCDRPIE